MASMDGKVAIVTGGASGIGEATVREFVARGASVAIADVSEAGASLAEDLGEQAFFVRLDVSAEDQWLHAIGQVEARCGPVSVLVNNAGIIAAGNNEGPLEDMDMAYFRRVLEVNQVGTFLGMKCIVPSMRRAGGGAIVNLSSAGGLVGTPFTNAYSSTKWAVVGMTKCSAIELGKYGIRVNCVHPGAIWTPIHHSGQTQEQMQQTRSVLESVVQSLPIARIAGPDEVARMIAFLASDEASYSTGAQFVIDGGLTIG